MTIQKNKVVTMDYTLKNAEGEVVDSTEGGHPLAYIHGVGALIPGLEQALDGKRAGDSIQVKIDPKLGYGERDESMVMTIDRKDVDGVADIQVGHVLHAETEKGTRQFRVIRIDGDQLVVDGNDELAGDTLFFDVTIVEVREATSEELAHGHVHGEHGHHH